MCKDCIRKPCPDRGTMCVESGVYLLNFNGCKKCGDSGTKLKNIDKKVENSEKKEIITFTHACSACGHVVCEHTYEFEIVEEFQEYKMDCLLCGFGESSHSILPEDPRLTGTYDVY